MKRLVCSLCCFVCAAGTAAGEGIEPTPLDQAGLPSAPVMMSMPEFRNVFSPSLSGSGQIAPHYTMPNHHYTGWYRPRAFGRPKHIRCEMDRFRPRGFGHLFNEPCTPNRIDYAPYKLASWDAQYGPAYYVRQGDQRCEHCDHKDKMMSRWNGFGCWSCRGGDCNECNQCDSCQSGGFGGHLFGGGWFGRGRCSNCDGGGCGGRRWNRWFRRGGCSNCSGCQSGGGCSQAKTNCTDQ